MIDFDVYKFLGKRVVVESLQSDHFIRKLELTP